MTGSGNNDTFAKALHNFTMDAACGDAIRALADKGYTLVQIRDALTFPAPAQHIAKVMWDHLVNTRRILLQDPNETDDIPASSTEIVERRDKYGHRSFLRIKKESPEEISYSPEDYVRFENVYVLKRVLEQVSSLSDHIPPKARSTGSRRDT